MDKLRSIEVFREVVRCGSFSAAGESLQVVTSAVSRQVSELEAWLGVSLLHRTTRSLGLTDEGQRYLDHFESIWNSVQDLEAFASDQRNEVSGALRITSFPFMADYLLKQVLQEFLGSYPRVQITLTLTDRLVSVADEGFDMAIRVGDIPDSNLIARVIGRVEMRTVASTDYLELHGSPQVPQDLRHHNCLFDSVLDRLNRRWDYVDNGKGLSVPVSGNLVANKGEMLRDLVAAGLGIAYLPSFLVDSDIRAGRLTEILGAYTKSTFPLSVVYPQSRRSNRALHLLLDCITEAYRGLDEAMLPSAWPE